MAISSSLILLGFSYLHCRPPQNIEHCIAPGARWRIDSDKREYFGPASFSNCLEARNVHFTCPLLLFAITQRDLGRETLVPQQPPKTNYYVHNTSVLISTRSQLLLIFQDGGAGLNSLFLVFTVSLRKDSNHFGTIEAPEGATSWTDSSVIRRRGAIVSDGNVKWH